MVLRSTIIASALAVLTACTAGGGTAAHGGADADARDGVHPEEEEAAAVRLESTERSESLGHAEIAAAGGRPPSEPERTSPRPSDRSEALLPPPESSAGRGASAGADDARGGPPTPPAKALGRGPSPAREVRVEDAERASPSAPTGRDRPVRRGSPSPGVQAGAADDNLQFNAFLGFVRDNDGLGLPLVLDDRIVLEVRDRAGRPVSGARVTVGGRLRRLTYADGRALLHPRRWGLSDQGEVRIEAGAGAALVDLGSARGRRLAVRLDGDRERMDAVPLDLAFVLDTTGSMGDELAQLRDTLDVITFQIGQMRPRPRLRLGMVLYRDDGDDYVTRVVPFTSDAGAFSAALAEVAAGGGGDYAEDVQSGLRAALRELDWGSEGLRLAFLVGDAPPHLDYGQPYTYVDAIEEAARRGIKITTVGASGLDRQAELVWRQIAQATLSPFVFLTYGEKGDAEGSPTTVSHHVGSNWVASDLDAIIVRMVKQELASFDDRGLEPRGDWFSATPGEGRRSDDVLEELFERSMKQLVDYAVEPLEARTPTVILPLSAKSPAVAEARARLERRLALGLGRKAEFRLVESERQADLLRRLAEQMSETFDEKQAAEVGKLVPARLAVLGHLDSGKSGEVELLVKLVRLETGEVLSLSLLKIDERLLL